VRKGSRGLRHRASSGRLSCCLWFLVLVGALLAPAVSAAEDQVIVDFSRSATITGGWVIRALPEGAICRTVIDDVRGTPRAMTLEIDLATLPAGSTGVALLPESPFADGSGTLRNVGVIRSVSIAADLVGADALLGVVFRSESYQETIYEFLLREEKGSASALRTFVLENARYIDDVRRREIEPTPLYPPAEQSLTFVGFVLRADALPTTGRLLLRVKEVHLSYDAASFGGELELTRRRPE
jgi:hypothetical protein